MKSFSKSSSTRRGFSLVEVTLAIGIVGMAILSLVGILGSTFQQVDDIMQTNRALAGVTRLIGALDNPRSIVYLDSSAATSSANTVYIHQPGAAGAVKSGVTLDPNPTTSPATNFDISYRLLKGAVDNSAGKAVWLYVYERKVLPSSTETTVAGDVVTYNVTSNPSVMEVAICQNDSFPPTFTSARNVVGTPMRVRLSISKLLIGQRCAIDASTLEPSSTAWTGTGTLPDSNLYALAYLPVVAEFFPHDYTERDTATTGFGQREETPVLIQNIIISR
jgi:type II secretory pathway pseudopilin PulG